MPTPCLIRFRDDQCQAHIHRDLHGHPEEVITNISSLKAAIEPEGDDLHTGNIAGQFVFLDKLWYALKEVTIGELEEELGNILFAPTEATAKGPDSYLHQHTILDNTTQIESVSFLYEIEVGSSEWQVKIGHNSERETGRVEEAFDAVSWGFSGSLAEAEEQFQ